MKDRISADDYFISMARLVALRGTCVRRKVGCVLVDQKRRVLATGYNGGPVGFAHCGEPGATCYGASLPSGTGLEVCQAIHAEQNAILQCRNPDLIHTVYVTVTPCTSCVKLLLNTPVRRVVAWGPYAHDDHTAALLNQAGVELMIYSDDMQRDAIRHILSLV